MMGHRRVAVVVLHALRNGLDDLRRVPPSSNSSPYSGQVGCVEHATQGLVRPVIGRGRLVE
jgi:hypothetical protein